MITIIAAIYEDGVFKPQEPIDLKDRSRVRLVIESTAEVEGGETANWKVVDDLIGCIRGAPRKNIGRDHDEILYSR